MKSVVQQVLNSLKQNILKNNTDSAKVVNMSFTHLAAGSVEPPRVPGLMRLYIMAYCPYALRPRLVLRAKGLPHDEVKINLFRKPEWYFNLNPKGLVPTLLDGEKIILESLDICDYLESTYPQNPLYPLDPEKRAKDKEIIYTKLNPVTTVFSKIAFGKKEKSSKEWLTNILEVLQPLEDELGARTSLYFGGENPGMIDYMLWPWAEAAELLQLRLGEKFPFEENHVPLMRKWRKAMFEQPVCKSLAHQDAPEKFLKIALSKFIGEEPNYDDLLGRGSSPTKDLSSSKL